MMMPVALEDNWRIRKRGVWKNGMLFQTSLRALTTYPDERVLVWVSTNPGCLAPNAR
jgi:hypothetical protein